MDDMYLAVAREYVRVFRDAFFRRIEERLQPFAEALNDFLYELEANPNSDWRERVDAFFAEQEAQGRIVKPEHRRALEEYLERWWIERLLPPPAVGDLPSDEADEEAGDSGFAETAITVAGSVVGIFVEPVDWAFTAYEIYNDPTNPFSYAGLIPFVPSGAGKAAKAVMKLGDEATGAAKVVAKGDYTVIPRSRHVTTELDSGAAKEVFIDVDRFPESARHLEEAGVLNRPLTVNREAAAHNRASALQGKGRVAGMDLDEAPPAMLREPDDAVSVRPISPADNRGSGASLGNQMRDVPTGGKVIIRPKPGG